MHFRVPDWFRTIEFAASGDGEEFCISFDADGLRRFMDLGARALVEAEEIWAKEDRGERPRPAAHVVRAWSTGTHPIEDVDG